MALLLTMLRLLMISSYYLNVGLASSILAFALYFGTALVAESKVPVRIDDGRSLEKHYSGCQHWEGRSL